MEHDNEYGYIKATIRETDKDAMFNMGWRDTPPQAPEPEQEPVAYVADGDKGSDVPGSREWHRIALAQMETKEDVEGYVKGICGADIDKRGGLDTVKEKALDAIMEAQDGSGDQHQDS